MKLIPNHIKNLITDDILLSIKKYLCVNNNLTEEELTYEYILEYDICCMNFYESFKQACLDNNKYGNGTGLIRYYDKLPCCSLEYDSYDSDGFSWWIVQELYNKGFIKIGEPVNRYGDECVLIEGEDYVIKPVRIADGVLRLDLEYLNI